MKVSFRPSTFFLDIVDCGMNDVILLHGALGAGTQLEPLRHLLHASGRNVHAIDFSGHHGKPFSENGFGIDVFANDVLAYLNEQKIHSADIFGYSMGGYVALWLAHLHPERVGRIVTLGTKFDWNIASAEKEIQKMNPEKIIEKVPAFARILQSRHQPVDWRELMRRTAEMMRSLGARPLLTEDILSMTMTPTLVCLGDRDDMADQEYSRKVAQLLPQGKFISFENTTHPIESLDPRLFMEAWTASDAKR